MRSKLSMHWKCFHKETKTRDLSCQFNYLHSCLAHEFHQQKHGLYRQDCGHWEDDEAKYHSYKIANVYFFLSHLLIVLYNQPTKNTLWRTATNIKKIPNLIVTNKISTFMTLSSSENLTRRPKKRIQNREE